MFPIQISLFSQSASQKFPKECVFPQIKINYLHDKFPFSVFFREQKVPFPENKVKETGIAYIPIIPNWESMLEICLISVYVNKLDFNKM